MNTPSNLTIKYVTKISQFNIELDIHDEYLTIINLSSSIAEAKGYSEASIDIADLDMMMTTLEYCRTFLNKNISPALTIKLKGSYDYCRNYRIRTCLKDQSIMITTLLEERSFSKCKPYSFIVRTDDDISELLSQLKSAKQQIASVINKLSNE